MPFKINFNTPLKSKLFLLFVFFLGYSQYLSAQQSAKDSINQFLDQIEFGTEKYCYQLANAAYYYSNLYDDSTAITFCDSSLNCYGAIIDTVVVKVLRVKSTSFYYLYGSVHEPIRFLEKGLNLCESEDIDCTDYIYAGIYFDLGTYYVIDGKTAKGLENLNRAYNLFQSIDSTNSNLVIIASNQVSAAMSLGNYEEALNYARNCIRLSKYSKDYETLGNLYYNTALIYSSLEESEIAKENYQLAYDNYEKGNLKMGMARIQLSLASQKYSDFKTGIANIKAARKYFEASKDTAFMASCDQMSANWYVDNGATQKAIEYIRNAIRLIELSNDQFVISGIYNEFADYWLTLGELDSVAYYAEKDLEISLAQSNKPNIKKSYYYIAEAARKKGEYQKAFDYKSKELLINAEIYDESLESKLAEQSITQNIEAAQRAKENVELKNTILRSEKKFSYIGLGVLLFILLLGAYFLIKIRKISKKLANQNDQLQQLNTTKDKFFGIIAHDIRNPITALDSVGDQMDYYLKKGDNDKLSRLARRVEDTSKRLTTLLDNLLNWALLQKGTIPYQPTAVNVFEIVNENFALYEQLASIKSISLKNLVNTTVAVLADEAAVSTIIRNLINNALKFTKEGGAVTVSTSTKEDQVFIEINDTGTGISAKQLDNIFKMNTNRSKGTKGEKGTGLGLMLCKDLIEMNKGNIEVKSKIGNGSTFMIALPLFQNV